jgi:hypothetical protein
MNPGSPPQATPPPWLSRETVESIAQEGTQCIVRSGDGELVWLALPGGGLAGRVRSVLAQWKLVDPSLPAPAESEVLAALRKHYRNFEGPEKPYLPRTLVNRNPRAAAREVLDNLRAARSRLLDTGPPVASPEAIAQAARQVVPAGMAGREERISLITEKAVQYASLRWKDDFIYDRIPSERIQALVRDLAGSLDTPAAPGR